MNQPTLPKQYFLQHMSADGTLDSMWYQYCHDRLYHTDVFNMQLIPALAHHALHLSKYSGILADDTKSDTHFTRVVDTVSTIMSMMARLNCAILPIMYEPEFSAESYIQLHIDASSNVARCVEQAQHTGTILPMMTDVLSALYCHSCSILYRAHPGIPVLYYIEKRRREIQSRHILDSHLLREYSESCTP